MLSKNVCHDGKQLPYIRVVYVKGKRKLVQPKEKLFPDGKGVYNLHIIAGHKKSKKFTSNVLNWPQKI